MKRFTAIALTFLCSLSLTNAQNVCEIYCTSFAQGKLLGQVQFKLVLNQTVIVDEVSKDGTFQFIMKKDDGQYELTASKKGYIEKIIRLNTADYPFSNEYEIQEIDLDFKKKTEETEAAQIGDLKFSEASDEFHVTKIDTALEQMKENYADSKHKLDQIYVQAVINGNEMMNMGYPAFAKGYFEMALRVKEEDEYAQSKLTEIQMAVAARKVQDKQVEIDADMMDKINKGEIADVPESIKEENVKFSVQLGAFSKTINEEDFSNVPDFKKIEYDDFTRCFSGEFTHVNEAITRKKEMVKLGYKDAWIVKLKGNERIGF